MDVPLDLTSYVRVLKMASTPTWEEFSRVSKIAGAGILLVGALGFLIFVTLSYIPGSSGYVQDLPGLIMPVLAAGGV